LIIVLLGLLSAPALADRHHHRPRHAPPAHRVETHAHRPGHVWIGGHYDWQGGNYVWVGGRYERERAGYRWRDHRWEIRDGVYTRIDGGWISVGPTVAPPAIRVERFTHRAGHVWVRGHWDWQGSWVWVPGHYERERVGRRWRDRTWVQRDGAYVVVEGGWD
jgi:hypothetical protein